MTRKHTNNTPESPRATGGGAAPRPAAPDIWSRPIRLRLPTGGIAMREWRAAMPSVLALAGFCFVLWGIGAVSELIKPNGLRWDARDEHLFARLWVGCTAIAAAVLGVLCGAEEEENGTADFAFRLPIARLRILAEKILGALAAFLTWHVAFFAVVAAASFIGFMSDPTGRVYGNVRSVVDAILDSGRWQLVWVSGYSALFFCFTLAAGAWIRKVIVAALAGGLAALVYGWVAFTVSHITWLMYKLPLVEARPRLLALLILVGCLAALAAAAVRYLTREGR